MRRVLPWLLAFAVLLGLSNFCWAQKESKPFLTVSFSGYDELMKDVELIGKLANFPGLAAMLEKQVEAQDPGKLLGCTGFASRGIRACCGVLSCFRWLHLLQATTTLPQVVRPPCARGTTCSIWKAAFATFRPQY